MFVVFFAGSWFGRREADELEYLAGNSYKDAISSFFFRLLFSRLLVLNRITGCLYPLYHLNTKPTFTQLTQTLPPVYSLAWNAISDSIIKGIPDKLSWLNEDDKAAIRFLKIYGLVVFFSKLAKNGSLTLDLEGIRVGPRFSEKFIARGCRTYADLKKNQEELLTKSQRIGLKHIKVGHFWSLSLSPSLAFG